MASKDGKIFDTIVYIGLGVNAIDRLIPPSYVLRSHIIPQNLSGKSGSVKGKTPLF